MGKDELRDLRKLSQHYAFTSIQLHEAIARKAGLSGTDHKYLGFIMEKGSMTAGDLAKLTGLTTGAVTGLIDRFEKKQLVKRQFAENDRRKVIIVPESENIMALFVPLYKEFRAKSKELMASFSGKERKVIERYFSGAIDIMNASIQSLTEK